MGALRSVCFVRRALGLFCFQPVRVHVLADAAAGGDDLGVGRAADVDEADLVVLAVAAAGRRLILVLEPVRADDDGIAQRAANVVLVELRAVWNIPRSSAPKWNSPMTTGMSTPAGSSKSATLYLYWLKPMTSQYLAAAWAARSLTQAKRQPR